MNLFWIGFFLVVSGIWSLPFKEKSFKYRKKISQSYQARPNQLAKIVLDEEVLSNSYMGDIRLISKQRVIPFVIRTIKQESKQTSGIKVPVVLQKNVVSKEKIIYTLRLPELPPNTAYTSLEIDAKEYFEADVSLMGQLTPEDSGRWNTEKIYKLDEAAETGVKKTIRFIKPDRFAFAKVEIEGPNLDYQFTKLNYAPILYFKEIIKKVPLEALHFTQNEDTESSIYYIQNENRIPFSKIRLDFSEKMFNRSYIVYEFSDVAKEYYHFIEGKLERKKNSFEPLEILFPRETNNPLKLEIFYKDNPSLNLTSLELIYAQQELIFELTEELLENSDSLYLYYGNPYIRSPYFDPTIIQNLENKLEKEIYLSTEKQEENPNFGYSVTEPPLSVWIMRTLFYVGLVIFVYLGYKVLLKYGNLSLAHDVKNE